jgi:hypothetical protein
MNSDCYLNGALVGIWFLASARATLLHGASHQTDPKLTPDSAIGSSS